MPALMSIDSLKVNRKLDGKGRLILPGDFREAAGFAPDQEVSVAVVELKGEKVFIIAKRRMQNEIN